MKLEFELCYDAEIGSRTANCPKQLGIFMFTGGTETAIRGDEVNAADTVASIAELGGKRSPRRRPANNRLPRLRGRSERHRHLKGLSQAIKLTGEHSRLNAGVQVAGIDLHPFHSRKVYNETAIRNTVAREAMAARSNGGVEVISMSEVDRADDIVNIRATDNYIWIGVNSMIPDAARLGILCVAGQDDVAFH